MFDISIERSCWALFNTENRIKKFLLLRKISQVLDSKFGQILPVAHQPDTYLLLFNWQTIWSNVPSLTGCISLNNRNFSILFSVINRAWKYLSFDISHTYICWKANFSLRSLLRRRDKILSFSQSRRRHNQHIRKSSRKMNWRLIATISRHCYCFGQQFLS